jgi:hypothetical protein
MSVSPIGAPGHSDEFRIERDKVNSTELSGNDFVGLPERHS